MIARSGALLALQPSLVALVALVGLTTLGSLWASDYTCEIGSGSVGVIRVGALKAQALGVLKPRYSVAEQTKPGAMRTLIAHARDSRIGDRPALVVHLDSSNRIVMIDAYQSCATKEGVGPGASLGQAQQVYGVGKIAPTDAGYYVTFSTKQGIMFLLDERDIPKALKGIPDDGLSLKQENAILALKKAKILAARVYAP